MARIIDGDKCNLIGEKLLYYRKLRGFSQKALSDKLELLGVYVCRGSISRIEDGQRTVTDVELCAFASVLRVDPLELISPEAREKLGL